MNVVWTVNDSLLLFAPWSIAHKYFRIVCVCTTDEGSHQRRLAVPGELLRACDGVSGSFAADME